MRYDPAVQIAGIHGSMSLTDPTCSFLDPPTNTVISANRAYNLVGPGGLVLPMYTAFPQIVNLATAFTNIPTGLASYTLSGLSRTIIENDANSIHYISHAVITLTDGASYRARALVRRSSGTRGAYLTWGRSGQRVGLAINLATGAITNFTQGGGAVSSTSSTRKGQSWLIEFTFTNAAWGGAVDGFIGTNTDGTTTFQSYQGDGTSGVTFEAVTLVASTLTPLGIAEGATRAADANIWTPSPAPSATSGEFVAIAVPFYWSVAAATQHPNGANANMMGSATGVNFIYKNGTNDRVAKADAGGTQVTDAPALADTSGKIRMMSQRWDASGLYHYRGATLAASDVAGITAPWTDVTELYAGHSTSLSADPWFGAVSLIYRAGGFSEAQRAALFHAFANGRTVPVVA
jgi:hypothetical protein